MSLLKTECMHIVSAEVSLHLLLSHSMATPINVHHSFSTLSSRPPAVAGIRGCMYWDTKSTPWRVLSSKEQVQQQRYLSRSGLSLRHYMLLPI